jgi:hypothetical protein
MQHVQSWPEREALPSKTASSGEGECCGGDGDGVQGE